MRTAVATLTLSLAATLVACAPSHYVKQAPAKPAQAHAKPAGGTSGKAGVVAGPPDYLHVAKDGKCADGLAQAYAVEAKKRHTSLKYMARNIRALEQAKAEKRPALDMWRKIVVDDFVDLRETVRAFNDKYQSFACPKRGTNEILSSDALNAGFNQLTLYVEGEIGPVPSPKTTKSKE